MSLQGQKVNYNLHKLTQRAWKGTGALAATQLSPDMDFPAEDNYTGSLFRVQAHCSERPTAGALVMIPLDSHPSSIKEYCCVLHDERTW